MWRDFGEVAVLIIVRKGFGSQVNVDIGFWIKSIKSDVPTKVEKCHIYLRVERLFHNFREIFLTVTDVEDSGQLRAMAEFAEYFDLHFPIILRELTTEVGLATAMVSGKLDHALIRKEARSYLENTTQH